MACCGGGSSVVIMGGESVIVTGSGTVSDPYIISGDLEVVLQAADTTTVALDLTGRGSAGDPFVISGVATVKVNDLMDVNDPTPAQNGDALMFNGTDWVYQVPLPPVTPGAVNVGPGLEGDGTLATPLKVKVSNLVDASTTGLYTYVDSAGEL